MGTCLLELGQPEFVTCVHTLAAELLLDTQELVVLGESLRTTWCPCLDLPGAQADGEISDERIFCFTGTVARHHAPAGGLAHADGLDRLRNRADLIHLEQQCIAGLLFHRLLHTFWVGHQQIIAYYLTRRPKLRSSWHKQGSRLGRRGPQRNDWIIIAE